MQTPMILMVVWCLVALAADDASIAPQAAANLQSTVFGHRSPVTGHRRR